MHFLIKAGIKKVFTAYQSKVLGLFTSTNIEAYGYCNRKCVFCFNNDRFPRRDAGVMSKEHFYKIIDELGSIYYAGRISPHFYGEVLLDKRIVDFIAYARKKVPLAHLRFSSNGDMLNEELLVRLIDSGLDKIFITNYDDCDKPDLIELKEKYPEHVGLRNYRDISLVNRAGQIFNNEIDNNDRPCLRPARQLVINWKGDVLLCCNDFYGKHSFGNVQNDSILNIWNSAKFKRARNILKKNCGRRSFDICKNCDL